MCRVFIFKDTGSCPTSLRTHETVPNSRGGGAHAHFFLIHWGQKSTAWKGGGGGGGGGVYSYSADTIEGPRAPAVKLTARHSSQAGSSQGS